MLITDEPFILIVVYILREMKIKTRHLRNGNNKQERTQKKKETSVMLDDKINETKRLHALFLTETLDGTPETIINLQRNFS